MLPAIGAAIRYKNPHYFMKAFRKRAAIVFVVCAGTIPAMLP